MTPWPAPREWLRCSPSAWPCACHSSSWRPCEETLFGHYGYGIVVATRPSAVHMLQPPASSASALDVARLQMRCPVCPIFGQAHWATCVCPVIVTNCPGLARCSAKGHIRFHNALPSTLQLLQRLPAQSWPIFTKNAADHRDGAAKNMHYSSVQQVPGSSRSVRDESSLSIFRCDAHFDRA